MLSVLAIVALLAAAGVTRRTIATGDNHYLQLTVAGATSYTMYRRAVGGDVVVEETRTAPTGASQKRSLRRRRRS